jgi:hypothetical protein
MQNYLNLFVQQNWENVRSKIDVPNLGTSQICQDWFVTIGKTQKDRQLWYFPTLRLQSWKFTSDDRQRLGPRLSQKKAAEHFRFRIKRKRDSEPFLKLLSPWAAICGALHFWAQPLAQTIPKSQPSITLTRSKLVHAQMAMSPQWLKPLNGAQRFKIPKRCWTRNCKDPSDGFST